MSTRMLIDARHTEETRVAIVRGTRVEEFDYESAAKQQLKGNIYLAKVTRVEPSLQAAFVEYGGNRHGFLAFSEIHPDYYQIPVEDREALLAEERTENALGDDDEVVDAKKANENAEDVAADSEDEDDTDNGENGESNGDTPEDGAAGNGNGEEEIEATIRDRRRKRSMHRRYKIQEVIKKRQILLIQVVKEERGNKGAALTTYLSLAGRYCVLMPNTTHGGGISRKIGVVKDRKRLRTILDSLDVPDGMGCIIRTAGIARTKVEIKRDLDYMLRLWTDIRELTLKSIAPALVYEEGNLIKRTIRDLYDRSIDEVLVEGEEGFKIAKDFMKLLMPSHVKNIQHYEDKTPLFLRYQVEQQLEAMLDPNVTLKSGGYLVINPTEALIAIDVNSGRSTREHNIEETALKTNLEAAEEVGRQIRQRDLAGLIVIDFIDMEVRGNNRKVEHRLKDSIKGDKARIQIGRISNFGLMEMSRQRLRPNLLEINTSPCPHCQATGRIRTIDSSSLHVLRGLEEEAMRGRNAIIHLMVPQKIGTFILNQKRDTLVDIEGKYGISVLVEIDDNLIAPAYELRGEGAAREAKTNSNVISQDAESKQAPPSENRDRDANKDGAREGGAKRSRRRGGRNRNGPRPDAEGVVKEEIVEAGPAGEGAQDNTSGGTGDDENKPKRRRRRGRRGGRRRRGGERPTEDGAQDGAQDGTQVASSEGAAEQTQESAAESGSAAAPTDRAAEKRPARRGRRRKTETTEGAENTEAAGSSETAASEAATETSESGPKDEAKPKKAPAARKPRASRAKKADTKPGTKPDTGEAPSSTAKDAVVADDKPATPKKPAARKRATKKDAPVVDKAPEKSAEKEAAKKAPAKKKPAARKPAAKKASADNADTKAAEPKAAKAVKVSKAEAKPTAGKEEPAAPEKVEAEPKKKGWWSR